MFRLNIKEYYDLVVCPNCFAEMCGIQSDRFKTDQFTVFSIVTELKINDEPLIKFSDEIMYGLGNIIQNAIEHARNSIDINISWNKEYIFISIKDDGKGFTNEILEKIGNPYISSKNNENSMGLGIFIAKNLIENIVNSIDQFDRTQENLDELIYLSKKEILRIKPLINDLTIAAGHLNKILATVDDDETLEDIRSTLEATSSISQKMEGMADDFQSLMKDKELTSALRDLTIGISKFLNEVYP